MLDWTMAINGQARAVAAYLDCDGIESSWDTNLKKYRAHVEMAPWYNGRERGLVFWVTDYYHGNMGVSVVAVFEHRNTDSIHCIEWEDKRGFLNPPTLADIPEGVYPDKWSTSFSVPYGEAGNMADHIKTRFEAFCQRWDIPRTAA